MDETCRCDEVRMEGSDHCPKCGCEEGEETCPPRLTCPGPFGFGPKHRVYPHEVSSAYTVGICRRCAREMSQTGSH